MVLLKRHLKTFVLHSILFAIRILFASFTFDSYIHFSFVPFVNFFELKLHWNNLIIILFVIGILFLRIFFTFLSNNRGTVTILVILVKSKYTITLTKPLAKIA